MKPTAAQVTAYLKTPDPRVPTVLLYGPDAGLLSERAAQLMRAAAGSVDDAFQTATFSASELTQQPTRLLDETLAMSLMGGRRAVRLRDVDERLAPRLKEFLETRQGDTLVVVEAGDLNARSALRKLFEAAPAAQAIPCYADGPRELPGVIRETLRAADVDISGEAVEYLAQRLGGDRLLTRRELEKLALYVGPGGRAGVEDVLATVGDSTALSLEDLLQAVFGGEAAAADAALSRLFTEGEQPVRLLRAAARHAMRLELATIEIGRGRSAEEVLKGQRPPIFFRYADGFRRQLARWSPASAALAVARLTAAEVAVKRAGFPAETLCREALAAVTERRL